MESSEAAIASPVLFTIGHSSLSYDAFVRRLRAHGLVALFDVRRWPRSRRHPHFDREALEAALPRDGVEYVHVEALGGMREGRPGSSHVALAEGALRGYADYMEGDAFAAALERVLASVRQRRTVVMCAEADPAACHRSLLADAVLARGGRVLHVLDEKEVRA